MSNAASGEALTDAEAAEVNQFLSQHLAEIVNLFRVELEHLENGTYKFPYDLNPATAPAEQWNPADVFAIAGDTLADQSSVSARRDAKNGQELLDTFAPDPERYPAYYLQNFHYQTDGWLSKDSARLYDFRWRRSSWGPRTRCAARRFFRRGVDAGSGRVLDQAFGRRERHGAVSHVRAR